MQLNFLRASDNTVLSKTYSDHKQVNSYPHVLNFDSVEAQVADIEEFYLAVQEAAEAGCCLLKGKLKAALVNESRAGKTRAAERTEWVCIDVDCRVEGVTPRQFLDEIDPAFVGVSFIFQHSASSRMRDSDHWRGHMFVLLKHSLSPGALKAWLIDKNLSLPFFRERIRLSSNGVSLMYPLDVTTCQNDKLIYIAPPICEGFDDPIDERFELIKGEHARAELSLAEPDPQQRLKINQVVRALREEADLPPKQYALDNTRGIDVLIDPDDMDVTGIKEERGFVYLNLNGGDSWAYYFPVDTPDIVYNFKGEPALYLKDVSERLYNEYAPATTVDDTNGLVSREPFGFLWPKDDTYYRGFYNPTNGELLELVATGSKQKLRDFFVQNGVTCAAGWVAEEWQLTFEPHRTSEQVNLAGKTVNRYRPSTYLVNATSAGSMPATIERVIRSVCGDDQEAMDYFINWFAYIFQTRAKTGTAWIFQGCQGTGKGVLFSYIISPLIGERYCHLMTMDRMDDDFNAYLQENIMLGIDEADISDSRNGNRLMARIKNLITEPTQHIRGMRKNALTADSYTNVVLMSNVDEIIKIEESDRRFNVAPRQDTPIQLDARDVKQIERELSHFANYLNSYKVNEDNISQVLENQARDDLMKLSCNTVDNFFHAVVDGDLGYFVQYLGPATGADMNGLRQHDYAKQVKMWAETEGEQSVLTSTELRTAYEYLQSASISPTKFGRMAAKYGVRFDVVRLEDGIHRGMLQTWSLDDEERSASRSELSTDNVVNIKKVK